MRREAWPAIAVLIAILAALAAKSLLITIPPVRPVAADGAFDTNRAMARLERILADERPHPSDSDGNDAVRARLLAEIDALGLQPIVRDQMACNDFQKSRAVSCARVRNVVAMIGPSTGKALLLNAHYDSSSVGPGAADDGIGVATLLEVAARMRDRPLRRPIIFLFNEGEELGLIGARAFLQDPLSRDVDAVLNFEARGVTGPVAMFETSKPNGAAIKVFGEAVRRPFASSMATDVYRLLPNGTDVTVFDGRGWLALNFAMVGNETRYHSAGDNLAALDIRSLQHMGDQALSLTDRLADGTPPASAERIFIDILGRHLVQMPLALGVALFALIFVAFLVLSVRRRAWVRAPWAAIVGLLLATGLAWLGDFIISSLRAGIYWRAYPQITQTAVYASCVLGALFALQTVGARAERSQMRVAFWATFLLVGAILAIFAPGAIIYFLLPPLVVLLGLVASRRIPNAEGIASLLALLALYLTWGEMLAQLEHLFSPGPQWILAPIAALMITPALIEATPVFQRAGRKPVLAGSALLALVASGVTLAAPAYSADRQQMFSIEHVTGPNGRSRWAVLNDRASKAGRIIDAKPLPDRYGGLQWTWTELPHSKRKRWAAPAPPAGLQPVSIEGIGSRTAGERRLVRVRLQMNGALAVALKAPADARLEAAGTERFLRPTGKPGKDEFVVTCTGRSCDGAELTFVIGRKSPVPLTVVGTRPGLPTTGRALQDQRPRFARPQYSANQTVTVSRAAI